jgi:tetratricopeptide (TPR) repeat protein
MPDFLKDLLSLIFKGVNRVIASIAVLLMAGCAVWVLATGEERNKYKTLILPCSIIAGCAVVAMILHYLWSKHRAKSTHSFNEAETGVLVLGIVGDGNNSLQRDLVSSLNDKLNTANNISVRAYDEQLDDTKMGLSVAHQKARGIGQKLNAQIVVWGNRVGDNKFWPRITIVKPVPVSSLPGERQLDVQEIDQMQLPESLVNEPVYLTFFLVGLSSYRGGQYVEALNALESASKHLKLDSPDIAPLKLYTANCRFYLAQRHDQPKKFLLAAIEEYQFALEGFGRANSPFDWATTQNDMGNALRDQAGHSEGAEAARLLGESVTAYRAGLEVRTREQLPQEWAQTQNNLGNTLFKQAGQSQGAEAARLLAESVTAYRAALEVRTRGQFPQDWAATQSNLSGALRELASHSEGAEETRLLAESVAACRAALEVRTREQLPQEWAQTQNNLGNTLVDQARRSQKADLFHVFISNGLHAACLRIRIPADAVPLLNEAVAAYRAALEVRTRGQFPDDWAKFQNNLGNVLCEQAEQSEGAEATRLLAESVVAYRLALEVRTREQFPQDWAGTQNNLGNALHKQAGHSEGAEAVRLLGDSVTAYRAALEVYTREQFPQLWAGTQINLGDALQEHVESAEATRLLAESATAYRAALEIYTRDQLPQNWAWIQDKLGTLLRKQAIYEEVDQRQGAEVARLLAESVIAFRAALEVFTRDNFPQWVMTQDNLSTVLREQSKHCEGAEAARLLAESVTGCRAVLEVYTREQLPQVWAVKQNNLGDALREQAGHIQGAEAARLFSESVTAYCAALEIFKPGEFPDLSSKILTNLAVSEQALHQFQK